MAFLFPDTSLKAVRELPNARPKSKVICRAVGKRREVKRRRRRISCCVFSLSSFLRSPFYLRVCASRSRVSHRLLGLLCFFSFLLSLPLHHHLIWRTRLVTGGGGVGGGGRRLSVRRLKKKEKEKEKEKHRRTTPWNATIRRKRKLKEKESDS